CGQGTHVPRTF
nr:immunoglobulin light chain junction region [Macaca mulatta]